MKKTAFLLLGCAAFLAACNNAKAPAASEPTADTVANTTPDTLTYKGEGPAADGSYEYTLSFYGDSTERQADLLQVGVTPQGRDTTAMTTGLVSVIAKDGKTYYRVSENKIDSLTFLQVDDSTLRLVNANLEEPENKGLATDLKLVK